MSLALCNIIRQREEDISYRNFAINLWELWNRFDDDLTERELHDIFQIKNPNYNNKCSALRENGIPCGDNTYDGYVYCLYHAFRLLHPYGYKPQNTVFEHGLIFPTHRRYRLRRPIAEDLDHLRYLYSAKRPGHTARKAWYDGNGLVNLYSPSCWSPPGELGMSLLREMRLHYIQLEYSLKGCARDIIEEVNPQFCNALYVRITGQLPAITSAVYDVIAASLQAHQYKISFSGYFE